MIFDNQIWATTSQLQRRWFRRLERMVPRPKAVRLQGIQTHRYTEKLPQQALIQKLAREISGLSAAKRLHEVGHFQEQSVIQRTLDELNEDIAFLSYGICDDAALTDLHERYLKAFSQEELSEDGSGVFSVGRVFPPRKKIRSYLDRVGMANQANAKRVSDTIAKFYSGYVHGASSQIMDMCWGDDPQFRLDGLSGTPLETAYRRDIDNYLYRSMISLGLIALALDDHELFKEISQKRFELDSLMPMITQ